MCQHFGFPVQAVDVDVGYVTAAITHGLQQRNIEGVSGAVVCQGLLARLKHARITA